MIILKIFPITKKNERASTFLGINLIREIDLDSNKKGLEIWILSQIDVKASVPNRLISSTLPGSYEDFHSGMKKNFKNFLERNLKKIWF